MPATTTTSTRPPFVLFPNGRVWQVSESGNFEGTVCIPDIEDIADLEDRLDAIAEAATGSCIGLTDFAYQLIGNDLVKFAGTASEYLEQIDIEQDDIDDDIRYEVLDVDSPILAASLAKQYGLRDVEVAHALNSLDAHYTDEAEIKMLGSKREIRRPADPAECDYVRVVVDGLEIAYWVSDEWQEAPAEVMGAIFRIAAQ